MDAATLDRGSTDAITAPTVSSRAPNRRTSVAERDAAGALAIVAHDLKGPLANLALILESILDETQWASPRIVEQAQRAERLVERLDHMLSAILMRARLHGDPLMFTPKPVDLAGIVETITALYRPLAASRAIRLQCRVDERRAIRGDADLLMQAVDNLVSNAIKHTRRGGLVVCEAIAHEDGAIVRVSDEGPGLTDDDLARAFRPFTRLSARADVPQAGHGLGLWIVRLIAVRHGGTIEARSKGCGKGAVFPLTLPDVGQ